MPSQDGWKLEDLEKEKDGGNDHRNLNRGKSRMLSKSKPSRGARHTMLKGAGAAVSKTSSFHDTKNLQVFHAHELDEFRNNVINWYRSLHGLIREAR